MRDIALQQTLDCLKTGGIVILVDTDREMEADLALSGRHCTAANINFLMTHARGILCSVLSQQRADQFGVARLQSNDLDPFSTPFGMPVSLNDGTTSVSASARARTINALAAGKIEGIEMIMPGHVQTLVAHPNGLRSRQGHTETLIELLTMAGENDVGVLCEVLNRDGEIASASEISALAQEYGLPMLDIAVVRHHVSSREPS